MRLVGIVLAVLMVAACPPRRGRIVYVQPCPPVPCVPAPVQPVTPPPEPVVKPADHVVKMHLQAWEKKIASINSLRAKISLKRTDTFKGELSYTGEALGLKPNYAIMRVENVNDPKTDFEAYICDGKSLYVYEGTKKIITEIKPPLPWPLMKSWPPKSDLLTLLTNPNVKGIVERFDVTLLKADEKYIYLDIEPREKKDAWEFKKIRLVLFGPNMKEFAYLPASLYVLKPNGDTEAWKFSEIQTDIPGLKPEHFKYVELKGWKLERMVKPEKP